MLDNQDSTWRQNTQSAVADSKSSDKMAIESVNTCNPRSVKTRVIQVPGICVYVSIDSAVTFANIRVWCFLERILRDVYQCTYRRTAACRITSKSYQNFKSQNIMHLKRGRERERETEYHNKYWYKHAMKLKTCTFQRTSLSPIPDMYQLLATMPNQLKQSDSFWNSLMQQSCRSI